MPALLDEASALALPHLGRVPDPVPSGVKVIVSRMVARVLDSDGGTPLGMASLSNQAGTYGQTRTYTEGSTAGGPWLTRAEKRTLRFLGGGHRVQSFSTR